MQVHHQTAVFLAFYSERSHGAPLRYPLARAAWRTLVPAGNAERAVFYLLVGQQAQHRAADPAGEALRTAYQAADEPVRAGELARRRDWPALWRLAQGLTLAEAIAAVRLIDPGWRPAGEPGRELLARLAGARLDTARPGKPALTTARIETSGAYVRVGAFSPDVRRFAAVVSGPSGGGAPSWRVCEFELPQGTMVAQHDYCPDRYPEGLLYIGGAIVAAGRFGSEVAIGRTRTMARGADEIALSKD
jgi:hypothetical protein